MAKNPAMLDRLRIATPCPIGWDQMTGDNRVRFCDHCHLHVYNIAELSRTEAEKLIAATEGRLCARLFRRADGTVLTRDCPVGLRALRRQVAKRTAAIFAAIVSLSGEAFGQESLRKDKSSASTQTKITRTEIPDKTGTLLSVAVTDVHGAAITDAKISITDLRANDTTNAATNDEGRFDIASLVEGIYSIKIESPGFLVYTVSSVVIERSTSISVNVVLEVGTVGEIVIVEPARVGILTILRGEPRLIDTPPGTTIFDEKMIQRLPHQK